MIEANEEKKEWKKNRNGLAICFCAFRSKDETVYIPMVLSCCSCFIRNLRIFVNGLLVTVKVLAFSFCFFRSALIILFSPKLLFLLDQKRFKILIALKFPNQRNLWISYIIIRLLSFIISVFVCVCFFLQLRYRKVHNEMRHLHE